MNEQPVSAFSWQDLVAVVQRRRRLIAAVLASGALAAALVSLLPAPTYEAAATLMVTSERARLVVSPDARAAATADRVTEQDLNSEAALLKSDDLVREVLEP